MPSPEVLDFAKLLAPIPGEKATGKYLKADGSTAPLYYKIRDARRAASDIERQLVKLDSASDEDKKRAGTPDWRPVHDFGLKVIAESSKDLELAAYLIEALVRLKEFPGLRDGFRLARELIERYWDDLYPLPEEGEDRVEILVNAIKHLNGDDAEGTLIVPIMTVPITEMTDVGRLTLAKYEEALSVSRISDVKTREKRYGAGAVSLDKFQSAIAETPAAFYITLVEDINECTAELAKLGAALDERCKDRSPPTSAIRGRLELTMDYIKDLARKKLPAASLAPPAATPAAAEPAAAGPGGSNGAPGPAGGNVSVEAIIKNRDEALSQLLKVAEYFRRTEPHSVVSYALEQAVAWGRMSLPELLTELLEEAPRTKVFKSVGIKPPES
jgi:type VI secretion system protein ImpA